MTATVYTQEYHYSDDTVECACFYIVRPNGPDGFKWEVARAERGKDRNVVLPNRCQYWLETAQVEDYITGLQRAVEWVKAGKFL